MSCFSLIPLVPLSAWCWCRCFAVQWNHDNSNSDGKRKTVWVCGGSSYLGQLNIQFAMLIIDSADFSALQCILPVQFFTDFIRNCNVFVPLYEKMWSVHCTNLDYMAVVLVLVFFTDYTTRGTIACDHALFLNLCNLFLGGGHDLILSQITWKNAIIWTSFWLDRKQYGWFALFQLAKMSLSISCCWFQSTFLLAQGVVNIHASSLWNISAGSVFLNLKNVLCS